jgi:hypothetical protein
MRPSACGHLLCEIIGGTCSLAAGVSRGCGTGPRPRTEIEPEVYDEIGALLGVLEPVQRGGLMPGPAMDAAVRLAAIIRREARDGRSVLAQARRVEPAVVPSLERLCARSR